MKFLHRKLFYPFKIYQEMPPFASGHNKMYDNDYHRCFAIDYKMLEYNSFSSVWGWYIRYKPFAIAKLRNNIIKFIFGTRMYYVRTEYNDDTVTYSEDLTKKQAKERVVFEDGDNSLRDIYYSHIEYKGFLFKSNKEKKSIRSMMNLFVAIHSR